MHSQGPLAANASWGFIGAAAVSKGPASDQAATGRRHRLSSSGFGLGGRSSRTVQQAPQTQQCAPVCLASTQGTWSRSISVLTRRAFKVRTGRASPFRPSHNAVRSIVPPDYPAPTKGSCRPPFSLKGGKPSPRIGLFLTRERELDEAADLPQTWGEADDRGGRSNRLTLSDQRSP
jgi:hypothetical protein